MQGQPETLLVNAPTPWLIRVVRACINLASQDSQDGTESQCVGSAHVVSMDCKAKAKGCVKCMVWEQLASGGALFELCTNDSRQSLIHSGPCFCIS